MVDIQLEATGNDLVYSGHDLVLIKDSDALAQSLRIRLKTFYGEWKLNTAIGIRYFEDILVKNPNLAQVEALFRDEILSTPEVNSIITFNLNYDPTARTALVTFEVDTVFGPIPISNLSL